MSDRYLSPPLAYLKLVEVMRDSLQEMYPGRIVSIALDKNDVPTGCTVWGIGEHGLVRFMLDYENHDLSI